MPWLGSFGWLSNARSEDVPWYLSGGVAAANCLAAFKPKGAADYATSKVNLVTPGTNDAADGAAFPTWAADTGWTFDNTSSQYLTITGAIKTGAPLSMVCRFYTLDVLRWQAFMGIRDTASNDGFAIFITNGAKLLISARDSGFGADNTNIADVLINTWYTGAASYAATNSRSGYLDGGSKVTSTNSVTPAGLDTTYVGCSWEGGVLATFIKARIAACAFYSVALSDAQVLALHTAMAAL